MSILSQLLTGFSLLKSEPHLIALMMIAACLAVVILAVIAGGDLDSRVFGVIFFILVSVLAIVGMAAAGYISLTPGRSKRRTDRRMEEVAQRYSAG